MSRRDQEGEKILRLYKQETGETDLHMPTVAEWAKNRGFKMPEPLTPVQTMARRLAKASARESRVDPTLGLSYRANVAYPVDMNGQVTMRWIDVDGAAPFDKMRKAGQIYRGGLLAGSILYTTTMMHWNAAHPGPDQLSTDTNFSEEVQWRLNASTPPQRKAS